MGTILVTEDSLERAVKRFLAKARIPIPASWTGMQDAIFIYNKVVPAFLSSLEELGEVSTCHNFNILDVCNPERLLEGLPEDENQAG